MRALWVIVFGAAIIALAPAPAGAQSAASFARKGNDLFKDQRYQDAIDAYKQALAHDPTSGILQYNLGTAYAARGDLDNTQATLEQAAEVPQTPRREDSYFNLGVAFAEQGKKESEQAPQPGGAAPATGPSPRQAAIEHLTSALQSFRQAILASPGDTEAKYNYEVTQQLLKKLQEQQRQDQQQQQQQQQNQNQGQGNNQNQQQQQPGNGQGTPTPTPTPGQQDQNQNQNQQNQNQNQQNQNQNQQQDKSDNGQNGQGTATPTPTPGPRGTPQSQGTPPPKNQDNQPPNGGGGGESQQPMTPQQMDAQRLLNMLEDEKPDQFKRLFQFHGQSQDLEKDW